jgi:2-polyprenyl-6-hydroxyphenyl methylase/3-demethylubiquinone-9 3-methyltransferase
VGNPVLPELRVGGYSYANAEHNASHGYLLPALERILESLANPRDSRTVFELGCGNGSTAAFLEDRGYRVTGVDPSAEGISQANRAFPGIRLELGDCYSDLAKRFGRFPIVLSLEVVEHVYHPRIFARCIRNLLDDDGVAIISTPFHGYWKNLVLAITGKMDAHFTALWDYGHIKFWSEATLSKLLREAGFSSIHFERVGRIRPLAKSMIALARP